jgi:NAD(P)-dependent dehydrogenase (short-subunit alcohol dehydrogenase family)
MGKLEGKVALVTGAGQGVGRGIALALSDEGVAVTVSGRTFSKVEAVAAEIADRGGTALAVLCDVTKPDDCARVIEETVQRFGGIDVLVNNAQSLPAGTLPLLDTADEVLAMTWASGPAAAHRLMRDCYPYLAERHGVIVNCVSGAAIDPPPGMSSYAAAKAAMIALTRSAAVEWGRAGIRAVAICPFMRTPGLESFTNLAGAQLEDVMARMPLDRVGDPERDAGRIVVFLVSDDARMITGTTITANAGLSYLH